MYRTDDDEDGFVFEADLGVDLTSDERFFLVGLRACHIMAHAGDPHCHPEGDINVIAKLPEVGGLVEARRLEESLIGKGVIKRLKGGGWSSPFGLYADFVAKQEADRELEAHINASSNVLRHPAAYIEFHPNIPD